MFRRFLQNSSLYLVILLIERLIIFIITPYLIRSIPIDDFGSYTLFLTFESALMPLVTLNLYSAIAKEFYEDGYDFRKSTYLLIVAYAVLSFFSAIILCIIDVVFPGFLPLSMESSIIAVFTGLASSLLIYFQTYFKLKNNILQYACLSILQSVLYFAVIYLVIKIAYDQVAVLFYSRLFLFIIILVFLIILNKGITYTRNLTLIKAPLKLTLPTVVFSFSAFLFVMADRFFISKYLGKATLGEYAAIYQIPALLSLITGAFSTAWIPWLYENLKKADFKMHIYLVKVIYLLITALVCGSVLFYFLIPFLGEYIFKKSLDFKADFILFIMLGFFFQGVYNLVSPLVFYSGKTKFHAYIGLIVSIFSIALNFILIPIIGLLGASITFCISWFLLALLFFIATFYSYKMPWFYFIIKK